MRDLRRFLSRRSNLAALALVALFVAVALAAPWLAPRDLGRTEPGGSSRAPVPPDPAHPLGRAPFGLDVYANLIWGTRDALQFGLTVTALTALLGIAVGAVSGYVGGWPNALAMRVTDAFLAFPAIASIWMFQQLLLGGAPFASAPTPLQSVLAALGATPVMLALILFSWMPYARLINTNVLRLKGTGFVQAAHALGAGPGRIVLRHLLPNAIAPAVVLAARDIGAMVILDAALTFIGMGGSSTWGRLLVAGRDYIIGEFGNPLAYWWVFLPATLAVILFGLGWNLLGDGLNRHLDPRAQR